MGAGSLGAETSPGCIFAPVPHIF